LITDLLFESIGKPFDVEEVKTYLASQPNTVRATDTTFMMSDSAELIEEAQEARRRNPKRFPITIILVEVTPERIDVSYRISRVEPARRFVEWLRQHYQLKYMDEEFNDLTSYCTENLDFLFGPHSA
jgi:hypothetical protein